MDGGARVVMRFEVGYRRSGRVMEVSATCLVASTSAETTRVCCGGCQPHSERLHPVVDSFASRARGAIWMSEMA